jgi:pilus assembly protein CpaF
MSSLEVVVENHQQTLARQRWDGSGPLWIGRDPSCDVVLDSELVSRRHACVERHGEELRVRDRSANGTRVGGTPLRQSSCALPCDAALEIGPYRVRLRFTAAHEAAKLPVQPPPADLRRQIQRKLLDHLDLARVERAALEPSVMRPKVLAALETICSELAAALPSAETRRRLIDELADEALGLGPLERLLADPSVDEIMVVDRNTIYVERRGLIEPTELRFTDDESVRAVIERIITPLGRRIDESSPLCDARLPDGSRVNAIIPPLASRGPCLTIRKFGKHELSLGALVERGSLTELMARFLECAVQARKNIVIAGGTGSGKTTLLNVLSQAIPERERIVTIEDAAELRLRQRHVVSLEAKPANMEGKGAYTIRDLVRNALRMRPDRIVVGECRGGEAIDMLQAMNTGHEGSMTTTHANSPGEAVARLETLCLMAGLDLPVRAIRQQIAQSVHLLVQQERCSDGSRRVTSITEVAGLDEHGDVELRELFAFERTGLDANGRVNGVYRASGCLPSFARELFAQGLDYLGGDA